MKLTVQAPGGAAARRVEGRRTADRLLDAAEALFAHRGYAATALRDIAEAVSIRQPGLYKHFSSKDELYRQVLQRALQPLADEMETTAAGPVDEGSFRTLTSRLVDVLAQHPHVALLLIRSLLSPPSERDEIGLEWIGRLADYGRRITRAAELQPHGELLAVQIVAIFNVLFGYFWAAPLLRQLSGSDPLHATMLERQKALLEQFVAGLEAQPPANGVPDQA